MAAAAGARVVAAADVAPEFGAEPGKGEALWKTVLASTGDLIVWCDADVRDFDPAFVTGLLGPLLTEPDVEFVKGFYERPETGGQPGGGRVTELLARPALALLHPALAAIVQPLSGEYAARRSLVEDLPFVEGYGVDIGLLLDASPPSASGASPRSTSGPGSTATGAWPSCRSRPPRCCTRSSTGPAWPTCPTPSCSTGPPPAPPGSASANARRPAASPPTSAAPPDRNACWSRPP